MLQNVKAVQSPGKGNLVFSRKERGGDRSRAKKLTFLENAKLLLTFFFIDKKTVHELNHAREQSAKLRGEIGKLETELEAEKQNHVKTLQELKELKSLHGKGNETKEVEITPDGLRKKKTTYESLNQKEQVQARQKEKCDYVDEKNKQEKQSENLEAAKGEQEKITQLQMENKQPKGKVTKKMWGFEKKLKDGFKKITKDLRLKDKRLHEQSNDECDAVGEEGGRLKEISGRKCFVQLLPHCRA